MTDELVRQTLEQRSLALAQQVAIQLNWRGIDWRSWVARSKRLYDFFDDVREDCQFLSWATDSLLRRGRLRLNGAHRIRIQLARVETAVSTRHHGTVLETLIRLWQTVLREVPGDDGEAAEAPVPLLPVLPTRATGSTR